MVKVRDAVVNKIRYTFYEATGSDGRIGISELFFVHPEATTPYASLLYDPDACKSYSPNANEDIGDVINRFKGSGKCLSLRLARTRRLIGIPGFTANRLYAEYIRNWLSQWRR